MLTDARLPYTAAYASAETTLAERQAKRTTLTNLRDAAPTGTEAQQAA